MQIKSKIDQTVEELKILIRARYPIVYIQSDEREMDVVKEVLKICIFGTKTDGAGRNRFQKKLVHWDIVNGFTTPTVVGDIVEWKSEAEGCEDPIQALNYIQHETKEEDQLFILSEFHHFLDDIQIQRRLRIFCQTVAVAQRKMIILLSPKNDGMSNSGKMVPTELENIIHLFSWPYPDSAHIRKVLTSNFIPNLNEGLEAAGFDRMRFTEEGMKELVDACKGMTVAQIDNATSKSVVRFKKLVPSEIAKEKKQIIKKSGLCEYIEPNQLLSDIGGNEIFKNWLKKRKDIQSEEAYRFGCDLPRGVLLLGPWGSGKSSAAKAVINEWKIPGIRVDASKIYSMYVGQSEQRINAILELAESVSPCILWWDEIENLLSGDQGPNDGGASSRVVGIISTWMAEHEGMVFNIFTANDISGRPPKLFRKGRLDEIFIVDLPVKQERVEILKIHVRKRLERNGDISSLDKIDYDLISEKTYNFSGSEIEAAINSAFIECYTQGSQQLTTEHILKAATETIPMSQTMKEEILQIRKWQEGRAIRASIYPPENIVDNALTVNNQPQKKLDILE